MPELCHPIRTARVRSLPVLMLILVGAALGGCKWRRFRPHPVAICRNDGHASAGSAPRATGSVAPQGLGVPAHRNRTPASRSRLSPDRAPHSRPRLEERVRRLSAAAGRPGDRRSCSIHTTYGRALIDEPHRSHTSRYQQLIEDCAQRHHAGSSRSWCVQPSGVIELDRKRSASLKMVAETVAARAGRRDRPHGREHADRAMGASSAWNDGSPRIAGRWNGW